MKLINSAILIIPLLLSFSSQASWINHEFKVMGTQAKVKFWSELSERQAEQVVESIVAEMQRIDNEMSPYKPTSLLSQINRNASKGWVVVTPELYHLFTTATKISSLSHGAFDITYASVGYQYNYREKVKPNKQFIAQHIQAIDYQAVELAKNKYQVRFTQPNVKVDLGGIAKGLAVKNCLQILRDSNVKHALVSAGGDTGLLGDKRGRDWIVGVKHPRASSQQAVVLPLNNEAISTSGDYERYFIEDGMRYHHIINPNTGDSAREVLSVSVIGADPVYTDALSTTVFVKGLQKGLALIESIAGYEAIVIDKKLTLHFSSGLKN
ncbi:thiamine biosynthesis protein ApbE [Saccharobesus litoralis]|uniref:FAD:protein FMN transferase n=1 Tax=Saccharobesus litoralis TaxID=2172099 RepID=A0A2S0VXW8_9ALTE|nr:FAD:protein FMN transferase [Saccharobesus litoralis]AWB69012.1 thiamine biosynthesis protein ApbE [Saccharobesus litoralis]